MTSITLSWLSSSLLTLVVGKICPFHWMNPQDVQKSLRHTGWIRRVSTKKISMFIGWNVSIPSFLVSHDFWYPIKSPWNSMKSPFLNCWCLSLLPEMPHFAKAKRPVAWSCHTLMAPLWRPNGRTQNDLRWAPQSARAAGKETCGFNVI